jgi:hypothetical protein
MRVSDHSIRNSGDLLTLAWLRVRIKLLRLPDFHGHLGVNQFNGLGKNYHWLLLARLTHMLHHTSSELNDVELL